MSTLTLRAVSHRFPDAHDDTLHAVTLSVDDGEMVSVVGPSGSGKTTLLRVAAGLEAPSGGDVLLDDLVVTAEPPERRDLTVMFQQPHLFTHLDVAGNVAFGPRLVGVGRREARATAERYLELVHLGGLGARHPRQLSGGQQQRVALARALATERSALLLDEPFSSLDPSLRGSMHELLAEVRAALSPTVVMVTHELDEAALADRTAVLVDGRLEQVAPVAELYRRPASLAVARLVGGFNEIAGDVVGDVHHSPWGATAVAPGCADGPAVLLRRREDLLVTDAPGTTATGSPRGPGEALEGVVVGVRQAGPRQRITVETTYGGSGRHERLDVELPLGQQSRPGARVLLQPAPGIVPCAVTDPHGAARATVPTTSG